MLPDCLAKASGAEVRTSAMVRELAPAAAGWRLTVGSAAAPERIDADAVIVAVPARPAGRLLAAVPGASAAVTALGDIGYASMAIVTLAYPRSAFPAPGLAALGWSGYLVPAVDGRAVKAVTFSSVKWPHLAETSARGRQDPLEIVRCSVGRIGEEALLQRSDDELAALAAAELAEATGVRGGPAASRVTRWGGALPQYTVGSPGPGGRDTRGGGGPARPRGLRRGVRRGRRAGLRRDGPDGRQPGPGVPRGPAAGRLRTRPYAPGDRVGRQ